MTVHRDRYPIAIVGSAFRMPGADRATFWDALLAGTDLVTRVEASRWAQDAFLHPLRSEPGTSYTFAAGSIGDVSVFDASFFGISPREAEQMDPQQRVLLELAWEAFEDANVRPSTLRGSRCGVYIGLSSVDYAYRRADDMASMDSTTMTGNAGSIAANRVSYVFDLRGPSMVIDTACSSSLVALHQACQSIRQGECESALVGGISLHLHPYAYIGFSKASMLSRAGHCSPFDEGGDGYVRSEGGAIVLLKPLAQAIADGNRILAVIAATGVNSDGRKTGLTVPSHVAQAALLREVYERAGIAPAEVDYFEAHGTGTAVGDPIEARAIGEAIGQRRPPHKPLPIGSVKANVGHLEAAAGMAGLVKALGVLRHRVVPANIHFRTPNPRIDFADWNLAPVTAPIPLDPGRRLVVGVSAFGFGGTNAHAVLASHEVEPQQSAPRNRRRAPLMLSARSPVALRASARDMARFLRAREDLGEYDIAYTAAFARETHAYRLSASGDDRAALAQALDRFAETGSSPSVISGIFRRDASAPAFVYSGNGSQWAGMGLQLLDEDPVFRDAVEEVDALFGACAGSSIVAELRAGPDASRFDRTEFAQPALFAIQVGLTRTLERRGVRPAAVCGHSVGEVAAAWACGALTLAAAVRVIHDRSAHQATTRGQGRMSAVALSAPEMAAVLASHGLNDDIVVAAINSPASVTVAGSEDAMARLETAFARRRVAFRRLGLDYAFHSAAMDPIRAGLLHSLAGLPTQASAIPLYSTVTGDRVEGAALGTEYWWRNVREPVLFETAVDAMMAAGLNTYVEIGPRAVLSSYLGESLRKSAEPGLVVSCLTRSEAGGARVRAVIEQLELSGALHDPARLFPVPGRMVDLPRYPWQRERHWHPTTPSSLGLLARRFVHPLLGYALAGETLHWENHLDTARLPQFADHAVGGSVVFPAAGFVEMALAAAAAHRPDTFLVIEDLEILAPLLLEREHSRTVRVRIAPADGRITISSRERHENAAWRIHVTARLAEECAATHSAPLVLPNRAPDVDASAHYERAHAMGLQYGPAFQSVGAAWFCGAEMVATIGRPDAHASGDDLEAGAPGMLLQPASLDGAFQLLADLAWREQEAAAAGRPEFPAFLPVRIGRLELASPRAAVRAARVAPAASRHRNRRSLLADFTLFDASGNCVATLLGVRFRAAALRPSGDAARWIATRAIAMPRRAPDGAIDRALDLPGPGDFARACTQRLHASDRIAARRRFAHEVEPLVDVLCAAFAERAVHQLAGDDSFDLAQLSASGRIGAGRMPLLQGLVNMLAEDGVLVATGDRWSWRPGAIGEMRLPDPQDIWTSLIGDYPEFSPLITRVGTAGLRLGERLGTDEEAGDLLLSEGASAWVDTCTQPEAAAVSHAIGDAIAAALEAKPVHARLRVLHVFGAAPREELGPGAIDLPDPDRCEYVIAAASRTVLDALRGRCPGVSDLVCHAVDLDAPGASLVDVLGGCFDIVVLGEGVAGAGDSQRRLDNVRRPLREDGVLILLEQNSSRAADLVYGADARWWNSTQALPQNVRSRQEVPGTWAAALAAAHFTDIQVVVDAPGSATGPYFVLARAGAALATATANPVSARTPARTWLLLHDPAGYSADLASALAAQLAQRGEDVVSVIASERYSWNGQDRFALDPVSSGQWERLLGELQHNGRSPRAWVHLAGLDLESGAASPEGRADRQEERAAILGAWLRASVRGEPAPDCWVVGAQAGIDLLPPAARSSGTADGRLSTDRLRDAALWGLARVAMQEYADLRMRWIDLADPLPAPASAARIATEMLEPDNEDEILLTAEGRFVPRMGMVEAPRAREDRAADAATAVRAPVRLDFSHPGPFRNLAWRTCDWTSDSALRRDEVEIEVRAAGLNFRDVMYAMGMLPDEAVEDGFCGPTLGMELAGVVARVAPGVTAFAPGDEVIAFAPASFATRVRTHVQAVTHKPAGWSHAAAATVPTAFFTAYYAIVELARLREGERLLIHGAAGGVGIAAIQVAQHLGAEIFATAGTDEKRDVVRLLGADHVLDSRSLTFADEVLQATGGEGVDVVLNSLAGEAMRRSLLLLRPFGRMLELGKRDFYENSRLGLRPFRNNISYFGIDADQLLARRPETAQRVFGDLMSLFADGTLRPLPYRSFCASDAAVAFRHMQASRHVGKIVLTIPPDFQPALPHSALPMTPALRADASYLVSGGFSGLGLRTAWWLVRRGARHLALLGRSGAATAEARQALQDLAAAGVTVRALACDITDESALRAALGAMAREAPPLRGIVHAAMVIEDGLIRDMDGEQLHRVLAPKIRGALNLHEITRDRPLDFFLLYSSATTLFGNPGQGAYVAANMAIEALAAERLALGLPATCVGWGPIGDTGYLARNERVREALVGRIGGRALTAADALRALDTLLAAKASHMDLLELDWNVLGRFLPAAGAPKFSDLARIAQKELHGADPAQDLRLWLDRLPPAELVPALADFVRNEIAQILRIAPERIEPAAPLFDLGMDSLMAVEVATSIETRLGIQLSALALGDGPTIERIVARIVRQLQPEDDADAGATADDELAERMRSMVSQHASEISEDDATAVRAGIRAGSATPLPLTRSPQS